MKLWSADAVEEDPVGAESLSKALAALRTAAERYDAWAAARAVYTLEPADSEARAYAALLDAVPPEQATVPVVLHAVLEQVSDLFPVFSSPFIRRWCHSAGGSVALSE